MASAVLCCSTSQSHVKLQNGGRKPHFWPTMAELLKEKKPKLGTQQRVAAVSTTAKEHQKPLQHLDVDPVLQVLAGRHRAARNILLLLCAVLHDDLLLVLKNLTPTLIPLASYPRRADAGSLVAAQPY